MEVCATEIFHLPLLLLLQPPIPFKEVLREPDIRPVRFLLHDLSSEEGHLAHPAQADTRREVDDAADITEGDPCAPLRHRVKWKSAI